MTVIPEMLKARLDREQRARDAEEARRQRHVETELPGNKANRERNEALLASKTVEAAAERHRLAEEARLKRAEERKHWTGQAVEIKRLLAEAENARTGAFAAGDVEAALVAHIRAEALKTLVGPLRETARHALGPTFSPFAERV